MNNSVFLSDSFENSTTYKLEDKFISSGEKQQNNDNKFDIEEYDTKKNSDYTIKSATTRKWSIKFKK